jgi:hypothetical protein
VEDAKYDDTHLGEWGQVEDELLKDILRTAMSSIELFLPLPFVFFLFCTLCILLDQVRISYC